jgi:hypothetical protein
VDEKRNTVQHICWKISILPLTTVFPLDIGAVLTVWNLVFHSIFAHDIIYPIELEIKNASDSVSYLGLHLEIDSDDRLKTQLYDKRDDFNFPIVNFPVALAINRLYVING